MLEFLLLKVISYFILLELVDFDLTVFLHEFTIILLILVCMVSDVSLFKMNLEDFYCTSHFDITAGLGYFGTTMVSF